MLRRARLLSIVVCLALVAVSATSVSARPLSETGPVPEANPAMPPKDGAPILQPKAPLPLGDTVQIEATAEEQRQALEYWSREARLAAPAMSFPAVSAEDLQELPALPEDLGEPGYSPGGAPSPDANREAQEQFPEEWEAIEELLLEEADAGGLSAEPYGTAKIYTSYLTNYFTQMWQEFPWKAVGKLYFSEGYCSASVISSKNIIVTAAHCVYDTAANRWYGNWSFVPAYRNGSAPYGTFPWVNARILTKYANAASWSAGKRWDVALIRLGNNSAGRSVTSYTGWLGRKWNEAGSKESIFAMGYPANLSDGTKYTYTCAAETFLKSTNVLAMGCNMENGSSGGPWVHTFKPYSSGANNYVNSVVSGGVPGSQTFWGAKFVTDNIVTLCNAEGC